MEERSIERQQEELERLDGICSLCNEKEWYLQFAEEYFHNLGDLAQEISAARERNQSLYDCILLYTGSRAEAFALYYFVEMGIKVLALTYDNGYISADDMAGIREILQKIGVEHVVQNHPQTDALLGESLALPSSVCHGCSQVALALALDYAERHGITLVISATLSRGQIIEDKLSKCFDRGITDVNAIEEQLLQIQKSTYAAGEKITELLGFEGLKDGKVFEVVKSIDFYRYCNITNAQMIDFLNDKDLYWCKRKDYAIYSANCSIKPPSDYYHLNERGYHYAGNTVCWEMWLGHLSLEDVERELEIHVADEDYRDFLHRFKEVMGEPDNSHAEEADRMIQDFYQ